MSTTELLHRLHGCIKQMQQQQQEAQREAAKGNGYAIYGQGVESVTEGQISALTAIVNDLEKEGICK